MNILILIPTYNECGNIRELLPEIFAIVPSAQVMVIDDSSPDGTASAVREMQNQFPGLALYQRPKKEGLGRAYVDAFAHVLAMRPEIDIICTMDADRSHRPEYLPILLSAAEQYDLVVGSRYIAGGGTSGWEKRRSWLSRAANFYCRLIAKMPIMDSTGGFCCYRAVALKKLSFSDLDPTGYAFQVHLKYSLWKNGASCQEIPICFYERRDGESKISLSVILEGILIPWRLIHTK